MRLGIESIITLVFFMSLSACTQNRPVIVRDPSHCEALQFIESGQYIFSKSKKAIPEIVKRGIAQYRGRKDLDSGSYADGDNINLSEVLHTITPGDTSIWYSKNLNFILKGDSFCLLDYTVGGWGEYEVVHFVQYVGEFRLLSYQPRITAKDTGALAKYLLYAPQPDTIWIRP